MTDPLSDAVKSACAAVLRRAAARAERAQHAAEMTIEKHGQIIIASTPESTLAERRARMWAELADEIEGME